MSCFSFLFWFFVLDVHCFQEFTSNKWSIPFEQLDMRNSKVLGKGFFGEVRLAYWLRQPVACKILYQKEFRKTNEMERFVREVDVLRFVANF